MGSLCDILHKGDLIKPDVLNVSSENITIVSGRRWIISDLSKIMLGHRIW